MVITNIAVVLRKVSHTCLLIDRGGLKYPSDELIARLWTIYKFIKHVLPMIEATTHILQDLVEFLGPRMYNCETFFCELAQSDLENTQKKELVDCILKKFISGLLNNKSTCRSNAVTSTVTEPVLNKNRRMLTLKQ